MNIFETREGIILALDSIRSNKFRAFMTILGVVIGVSSVIAMVALIQGLNSSVENDIQAMGSNVIYITKYPFNTNWDELTEKERNREPITLAEANVISELCPSVDGVAPQNHYFRPGGNVAKYKENTSRNTDLFGTSVDYELVNNHYIEKGRFFLESEDRHRAMVCVIGHDIAATLFTRGDPIGEQMLFNNLRLKVVGVMEKRKTTFGEGQDNMVIIPYGTFQKLFPWEEELFLAVRASNAGLMETAQDEIRQALRRLRGVKYSDEDDFAMATQESILGFYNDITKGIWIAMIAISSVGLMVGGIGVLNIMLVSVTERTREIGVRKAIGARRVNVFFQFLVEAMTLSGTGGVIGIVFGLLAAFVISAVSPLPMVVPVVWVFAAFAVSVGVGLAAGVIPAWRAASVDPIVSLHYE
jgi:putative ABC transport system permease protein